MQLEQYLEQLLYRHECVIIPGFGGFVSNFSPARVNPSTHMFHPPARVLTFNRNLRNNDGLLANYIATTEGTSFTQALDMVRSYVDRSLRALSSGNQVHIPGIGSIRADRDGKISFHPEEGQSFLQDSFGLKAFKSPPVRREEGIKKLEKQFKDRVAPETVERGIRKRKVRPARVIVLAAGFLLLAGLVYIPWQTTLMEQHGLADINPFRSFKPRHFTERKAEIPSAGTDFMKSEQGLEINTTSPFSRIRITDDGPERIVSMLDAAADPDKTNVRNNTKDILAGSSGKYHLIAGAFAVPQNADNYVLKLRGEGFSAGIMEQQFSSLRYVSVGNFSSREDALKALHQIKSQHPEVWMLIK